MDIYTGVVMLIVGMVIGGALAWMLLQHLASLHVADLNATIAARNVEINELKQRCINLNHTK